MLVTAKEILDRAAADGYAVIIARTNYSAEVTGAIRAAEEMHAPLILELRPDPVGMVSCIPEYLNWVRSCCNSANAPIALSCELDPAFEEKAIIESGVSMICMYDSPRLPRVSTEQFQQNAQEVHDAGAYVVTKIGDREHPVEPENAVQVVQKLGIDFLTVELSLEGEAGKTVDFARLKAVKETLDQAAGRPFPLILHGCQGIAAEALRQACAQGVSALNISKDCWKYVKEVVGSDAWDPFASSVKGVNEKLKELIEISGSAGKA